MERCSNTTGACFPDEHYTNALADQVVTIYEQPARYVRADGSLDMPKLFRAWQSFWRKDGHLAAEGFNYREAGPHLMLMAFLQRIGPLPRSHGPRRRLAGAVRPAKRALLGREAHRARRHPRGQDDPHRGLLTRMGLRGPIGPRSAGRS